MDDERYLKKQQEEQLVYEEACNRCGRCCGAGGSDPCAKLMMDGAGLYFCSVYNDRLGPQKTVSGNVFTCVTIKDVQRHDVFYGSCGYDDRRS